MCSLAQIDEMIVNRTSHSETISAEPLPAFLAASLEMLPLQSWILGHLEANSPWGLAANGRLGWFHLLEKPCLVRMKGQSFDLRGAAGDFIVVLPGNEHELRDTADSPITPVQELVGAFRCQAGEQLLTGRTASTASVISGCFFLAGIERSLWQTSLPPVIWLRGDGQSPLPCVERILRLILAEVAGGDPWSHLIVDRLVRILLIKVLQDCVSTNDGSVGGWLTAIADPDLGPALALMHGQPDAPWTVASLAERVAMSRSVFSARFSALVGRPPLQYLADWRMQKASHLLRTTRDELKEVAAKVGYESPSAFSKAFARWSGMAPSVYRANLATGADSELDLPLP